jgi:xylitol oxidase
MNLFNWAGNHRYAAAHVHQPRTTAELREVVRSIEKLKALGTRHSFNDIADTGGDLISLEHFNHIGEPDARRRTVTVGAGVRYGELCAHLNERGFALHNLASLPHISVAGAVATATHGSGVNNGNLATAVAAIEMITADGELRAFSRESDGDTFNGVVVALGALGMVTKLTLDLVPTFQMRQQVYQNLPMRHLEDQFDAVMSAAYSVSLFTDWTSERINQVWVKRRVDDPASLDLESLDAKRATSDLHPIATMSPENCTQQMNVPGPWHERLPHFRMEFTPSAGEELQSEYFLPRERAVEALRAIDAIRDQVAPVLQISEIRTIAADELWLSPCYQRASVAIHFTWKKDWPAVRELLPVIEQRLSPFAPRPHWGKLFTLAPAQVQSCYPKLPDFRRLTRTLDPQEKFRNRFLSTLRLGK